MKLPRPLSAALCGFTLVAIADAQERARDERPADGQRPPRGEFRPNDTSRGSARPTENRPSDNNRRTDDQQRGDTRQPDGQRGQAQPGQFNPQELFRDLNEDQRTALRGFFEQSQKVARDNGELSQRLRREIGEAALAEKLNENVIREKTMEVAKLEAEATIARARAFAQVRNQLPRETVERLRMMVAGNGPRPGMQGPMQGGPDSRREGDNRRRPGGDNAEPSNRRPTTTREGDRGPRPEGDRSRPTEGERRPEQPRRPEPDRQ